MEKTTNIVVSRYKKNTDFVYKLIDNINMNIFIYDKENPLNPYNIPVNKGNEASVYLKYIVDNYDNLSDYTFFIHDEEYAWHHSNSIIDRYKEAISLNKNYYNVNDLCEDMMIDIIICCNNNKWTDDFMNWYRKYIQDYIPFEKINLRDKNRYGAQFLVHKDVIQKLPKKFYEDLYSWIITTDYENAKSGRFLEWTWHIFWDIYPNL
jgi:hypothetical protein